MEFAYDAKTQDLIGQMEAFMDEVIYPAEPTAHEQIAGRDQGRLVVAARDPRGPQGRGQEARDCGTSSSPVTKVPG